MTGAKSAPGVRACVRVCCRCSSRRSANSRGKLSRTIFSSAGALLFRVITARANARHAPGTRFRGAGDSWPCTTLVTRSRRRKRCTGLRGLLSPSAPARVWQIGAAPRLVDVFMFSQEFLVRALDNLHPPHHIPPHRTPPHRLHRHSSHRAWSRCSRSA